MTIIQDFSSCLCYVLNAQVGSFHLLQLSDKNFYHFFQAPNRRGSSSLVCCPRLISNMIFHGLHPPYFGTIRRVTPSQNWGVNELLLCEC